MAAKRWTLVALYSTVTYVLELHKLHIPKHRCLLLGVNICKVDILKYENDKLDL